MGHSRFQNHWMDRPEFVDWLRRDSTDVFRAYCRGKTCRQHDAVETADTNNEFVLLRILNCCVDPVPVRNDYFGGGVCMSVYYDLFHMTGCVSLF